MMWVATLFMKYYVPVFDYIFGMAYNNLRNPQLEQLLSEHQIQSNFPKMISYVKFGYTHRIFL